jgi:hypothetical protein
MSNQSAFQSNDKSAKGGSGYHTYMVRGGYLSSPEEGAAGGKAGGMYAAGGKAGGMYAGAGYDDDQSSGDERSVYKTAGPSVYSRRDTAGPVEKRGPVREPVLESSVIDVEMVHERAAQLVSYFQALLVGRKTQLENEKHENASLAAELAKAREEIKALRKENAALIKENAALSKRKDYRADARAAIQEMGESLQKAKIENNLFRAAYEMLVKNISEIKKQENRNFVSAIVAKCKFPEVGPDAEHEEPTLTFSDEESGQHDVQGPDGN